MSVVVKLPEFGNEYEPHKQREMVRQIEYAMREINRLVGGTITIINPPPTEPTPNPPPTGESIVISNETPSALGNPHPGTLSSVSRADHVHPLPNAGNIGADPEGTAQAAVEAHEAAENPHPQYFIGTPQVYSRNRVEVGEDIPVPRNVNLIMYDHLDLRGSLDLMGALCDASP